MSFFCEYFNLLKKTLFFSVFTADVVKTTVVPAKALDQLSWEK